MKKVLIVNTLPVPSGNASVNRILSYAKGMVECGDSVDIVSSGMALDGNAEAYIDGIGIFNNGRSKSVKSLFGALWKIISKIRRGKYDVIISTTNSLLLIYPLFLSSKLIGAKLLQEKSEFPFVLMRRGVLNKLWAFFYVNTTYKLMDGIIVMTNPLYEYFQKKTKKDCKFIVMPMTVDGSRFNVDRKRDDSLGDYIAYCGDMSGNKDGVTNLIKAFSYVEPKINDVSLLLIGGTTDIKEYEKLQQLVKDLGLKKVVFYGRADRSQMPQLLKNAKVLALARPSSLQSKGGFPTKLGEYLSTGNPVVVTAVGDIPQYLNETNAFVVEPDNNEAFANALIYVLSNNEKALLVGEEGKKVAEKVFNYKVQSRRLHEFINNEL